MYHFCTITSYDNICNAMALLEGMQDERVNVLCLDKITYAFFHKKKIKNLKIFLVNNIETQENLSKLISTRSKKEFIFTIKPIFINFLFKKIYNNQILIYLDSDIFFFNNVKKLKEKIKKKSIFLSSHNFSKNNLNKKIYGIYNAGFVAFKKDLFAEKALKWWMYKCIKKCQLQPSKYNFADQKYLDQIPKKFKKVQVLEKNIFNIAPWNFDNLSKYNYKSKGSKIVFFHFQGLKFISKNFFYLGLNNYSIRDIKEIRRIYYFYCLALKNILIRNNINIGNNFFQTIKFFLKGIFHKDFIYIK